MEQIYTESHLPNTQLQQSDDKSQINIITTKISLLLAQNREFDCIQTTLINSKAINNYDIAKKTISFGTRFYLANSASPIHNKKIIELTPSIISYNSKGKPFNINGCISTNGVILPNNLIAFMHSMYSWLQWECLRPNKYIISCKDFALGYALNKFKPQDINTLDKFLAHPFFDTNCIKNKEDLEDLRNICGPLFINYSMAVFVNAALLTTEEVIEVADTIYNYHVEEDSHKAKQLQEKFLELFPIRSHLSFKQFMDSLNFLIAHTRTDSIATAILTKKPLCGLNHYNFNRKYLQCSFNKEVDCDKEVKAIIETINYSMCSSFSINSFPDLLQNIATKFLQQQETNVSNFLWLTPSHAMTLRLKKKDDGLKILFFDPGLDVARTKNFLIKDINELKHINVNTFLAPEIIKENHIKTSKFDNNTHSFVLLSADISQEDIDKSLIKKSRPER